MSASIGSKIRIGCGDITKLSVDVIVNAANNRLLGGGGVDGAIHHAAGRELLVECRTLGGCETGEAKLTKAYNIKQCKGIIHVVGPIVADDVEPIHMKLLSNCYLNALSLMKKNGFRSIGFPCISTGIYLFPSNEAAKIALSTTKNWLSEENNANSVDKIVFCVFLEKDLKIYQKMVPKTFPDVDRIVVEDVESGFIDK